MEIEKSLMSLFEKTFNQKGFERADVYGDMIQAYSDYFDEYRTRYENSTRNMLESREQHHFVKLMIAYGKNKKETDEMLIWKGFTKEEVEVMRENYSNWLWNLVREIRLNFDGHNFKDGMTKADQLKEVERIYSANDHLLDENYIRNAIMQGDWEMLDLKLS